MKGTQAGPPPGTPWEQQPGAPAAHAAEPPLQQQALQVLNLAQRTGEEHIASARREADKIRLDARAMAEQIVRDAQAHADETQRNAQEIFADAQARAADMAKNAQAKADELTLQAQQRYEDVVGSLATRREALQQQIEALEQFDREYRARLTGFMQSQLRALWVDQPRVEAEGIEPPEQGEQEAAPAAALPAQRARADRG